MTQPEQLIERLQRDEIGAELELLDLLRENQSDTVINRLFDEAYGPEVREVIAAYQRASPGSRVPPIDNAASYLEIRTEFFNQILRSSDPPEGSRRRWNRLLSVERYGVRLSLRRIVLDFADSTLRVNWTPRMQS